MSDHSERFIDYLMDLSKRDRGALAVLRRSLARKPGNYPAAYAYVERFVGRDRNANDSRRLALYLAAGLFGTFPQQSTRRSFSTAWGELFRLRDSGSIEKRFLALLAAEPDDVPVHLRQAVSLLSAADLAFDYIALLDDLNILLNAHALEGRDKVRQRWAREFYRTLASEPVEQK